MSVTTAHFIGTLDGVPYDELFPKAYTVSIPDKAPIQELNVDIFSNRLLHLEWPGPTVFGEWIDVTGRFELPSEKPRAVLPGSKLRLHCRESLYQYILIIEGGALNACGSG